MKDFLEIFILMNDQIVDYWAECLSNMSDVKFKNIIEVDFTSLLKHIVAHIIAKNGQKHGSNIMKSLDIPKLLIMIKKVIQHNEDIILSFFPK